MPIALDDLCADRVDVEAKLGHHLGLDLRRQLAVGPDCPGQLSDRQIARRLRQPVPITTQLESPEASLSPNVIGSA